MKAWRPFPAPAPRLTAGEGCSGEGCSVGLSFQVGADGRFWGSLGHPEWGSAWG